MNSDPIANVLHRDMSLGEWAIEIVVNEGEQQKKTGIYPLSRQLE